MATARMGIGGLLALAVAGCAGMPRSDGGTALSFADENVGAVPEALMILKGRFRIAEDGGERFLELPGEPLDTFGAVFGPFAANGQSVRARVMGTPRGRRAPQIGVGLNGAGGFRLWLSPAKREVEISRGKRRLSSTPYAWTPGSWTRLAFSAAPRGDGAWIVRGKAWTDGEPEPEHWLVEAVDPDSPPPGRPSVWGIPYAGTPIRFDDLEAGPAD